MNKQTERFIKHVKDECRNEGVKCDLRNTTYVKLSSVIRASGYFDETVPTLVCSMKRPDSLEILAHEYSHLTQWRERIDLWKAVEVSMPKLDEWLEGKDIPSIERHIAACRDLELDNEKRAVKIIKEFELPIDINHYVKKANAYVMFYNYMMVSRRWCTPKNSPYKNKTIIEAMPNKFNMKYSSIPTRLHKLFESEGF